MNEGTKRIEEGKRLLGLLQWHNQRAPNFGFTMQSPIPGNREQCEHHAKLIGGFLATTALQPSKDYEICHGLGGYSDHINMTDDGYKALQALLGKTEARMVS